MVPEKKQPTPPIQSVTPNGILRLFHPKQSNNRILDAFKRNLVPLTETKAISKTIQDAAITFDDALKNIATFDSTELSNTPIQIDLQTSTLSAEIFAQDVCKKIEENICSIETGITLIKQTCPNDIRYQVISDHIVKQTNGDITTLPQLLEQYESILDSALINEITLCYCQTYLTETTPLAMAELPRLLTTNPATSITLTIALSALIQQGSLDHLLDESTDFFNTSQPISKKTKSTFKDNDHQIEDFISRLLRSPEEYEATFNSLMDESAIALPILKAFVQDQMKQCNIPIIETTIDLLEQLEAEQLTMIRKLKYEQRHLLDTHEMTTDNSQIAQKYEKITSQLNQCESGELQANLSLITPKMIAEITTISEEPYANRSEKLSKIIDKLTLTPFIKHIIKTATTAILNRSNAIDDIESDINNSIKTVIESEPSITTELAKTLMAECNHVIIRYPSGIIENGQQTQQNLHIYNILKPLILEDSSIDNQATTIGTLAKKLFSIEHQPLQLDQLTQWLTFFINDRCLDIGRC